MTHKTLPLIIMLSAVLAPWLDGCAKDTDTPVTAPSSVSPMGQRPAPTPVAEKTLTSLAREIAELKREQARLTRSLQAMKAELARVTLSADPTSPNYTVQEVIATDEVDGGLAEEAQFTAMVDELDRQLAHEPVDPTWSQRAELDVASLLQLATQEGSQLLNAECRATLCQVEIAHTDVSAQQWLLAHLPQEAPFDGEQLIHEVNEDPEAPRTRMYLARQGHPLLTAVP
jgi:hypothetical protein